MRFELTTSTLARLRSTTELRPRYARLAAFVLRVRSSYLSDDCIQENFGRNREKISYTLTRSASTHSLSL